MKLRSFLTAAALVLALAPTTVRSEPLPMSVEEFKLWRDYQSAVEDPRVQKLPEARRFSAIAKNFGVSEKELRAALEKGEKHGSSVATLSEEAIRAKLADTQLAARLKTVRVDASAAHVVTYLGWTADKRDAAAIDVEVCIAAARAFAADTVTSTFKIEVLDADGTSKLFEALISRGAAGRIRETSIVDFASTRYLKLFEKVQRVEL